MTLSEFKAWFEGFSEGIDKAPTEKQFAKIKAKVALIDGTPVTYPIFVDRYWPHPWHPTPYWGDFIVGNAGDFAAGTRVSLDAVGIPDGGGKVTFDSISAMTALGRAESMN